MSTGYVVMVLIRAYGTARKKLFFPDRNDHYMHGKHLKFLLPTLRT
jgi:hypothetical protein